MEFSCDLQYYLGHYPQLMDFPAHSDPTIKKFPTIPNPILVPTVLIKKSELGIPSKPLLTQAYDDKLNGLFLKCKVLNYTICIYQEHNEKLESEYVSDDDDDNGADGKLLNVIQKYTPLLFSNPLENFSYATNLFLYYNLSILFLSVSFVFLENYFQNT